MRLYFTLIISLFSFALFASDTLTIDMPVQSVKIFPSSAKMQHSKEVQIESTTQWIKIKGLSPELKPSSIRLKGGSAFEIVTLKIFDDYEKTNPKLTSKEQNTIAWNIRALQNSINRINVELDALDAKRATISANERLASAKDEASVETLRELVDYSHEELLNIGISELELYYKKDSLKKEINYLNKRRSDLSVEEIVHTRSLLVKVQKAQREKADLQVEYLVASAGWNSLYDIRVPSIEDSLQLVHHAHIWQESGIPWKDVDIVLSTAPVGQDATLPTLKPWKVPSPYRTKSNTRTTFDQHSSRQYSSGSTQIIGRVEEQSSGEGIIGGTVSLYNSSGRLITGTDTDFNGNFRLTDVPPGVYDLEVSYVGYSTQRYTDVQVAKGKTTEVDFLLNEGVMLESVNIVAFRPPHLEKDISSSLSNKSTGKAKHEKSKDSKSIRTNISEKATSIEYSIPAKHSLKSDGEPEKIQVEEISVAAEYEYRSIPKLDRDAFLIAIIENYESLNLPKGPSNLYFEGGFVGESYLDFSTIDVDSMEVSLGRDPGVVVSRKRIESNNKNKWISNKRVSERIWEITVTNKKSKEISLVLQDQIPVSTEEKIEVEHKADEAHVDERTGAVSWQLRIPPSEQEKVEFSYTIKYPRGAAITQQ